MIEFAINQEDRNNILLGLLHKSEYINEIYFIQNNAGVLLMVSECPNYDYASYFFEYKSDITYGIGSMPIKDFRLTDYIKIADIDVTDATKLRIKELARFEPNTQPTCDFNHDGITNDILSVISNIYESKQHKNFLNTNLKAERLSNLVMLDFESNKIVTTNGQILKGYNINTEHNTPNLISGIALSLDLIKKFMTTPYRFVVYNNDNSVSLTVQIIKENYLFARNLNIEQYPAYKKLFEVNTDTITRLMIRPSLLNAMINALPKDPEVNLENNSDYKSYHALRFDMQNKIMRVESDNPTIKKVIYRLDKYITVDNCKDIIYFNLDYFKLFLLTLVSSKEDMELIFTGAKSPVILNGTHESAAFMPCMLNKYYVKGLKENGQN